MEVLQGGPSKEESWEQIRRVLESSSFVNSDVLRSLLTHLAHISIEEPGRALKEYEIGTDALGRGPNFDPRVDSGVRVHSARLRTKLTEYYHGPGAGDPVDVFLPKGTYLLSYRYRTVKPETESPDPVLAPEPPPKAVGSRRIGWYVAMAAALAALWVGYRWQEPPSVPPSVRQFWSTFDSRPASTLVVFSNPRFVGSASAGLRYAPPKPTAPSEEVNDRYTGIGEAMALHELTRLFDRLHLPFLAKRSSLIAWDEARTRNLVFIGGPNVNDSQAELPTLEQFGFKSIEDQPSPGLGAIVNLHPAPGEQSHYFNSGPPYVTDYAVIGVVRGMVPERRALIIAGRTTFGTQGATEFLLDENHVSGLLKRLRVASSGGLPFFEALLRVKVSGGVPVQPELVLLKNRQ